MVQEFLSVTRSEHDPASFAQAAGNNSSAGKAEQLLYTIYVHDRCPPPEIRVKTSLQTLFLLPSRTYGP